MKIVKEMQKLKGEFELHQTNYLQELKKIFKEIPVSCEAVVNDCTYLKKLLSKLPPKDSRAAQECKENAGKLEELIRRRHKATETLNDAIGNANKIFVESNELLKRKSRELKKIADDLAKMWTTKVNTLLKEIKANHATAVAAINSLKQREEEDLENISRAVDDD